MWGYILIQAVDLSLVTLKLHFDVAFRDHGDAWVYFSGVYYNELVDGGFVNLVAVGRSGEFMLPLPRENIVM